VVQQSQGRVSATQQARGLAINADAALEHEANEVGSKAARGESVVGDRQTSPISPDRGVGVVQRQQKGQENKEDKVPFLIRFDRPLTRDEFIQIANLQIHGVHPGPGQWQHVAERYQPEVSPVEITVAASLVKKSRSERHADLGFGVDDQGTLAGGRRAGRRALGHARRRREDRATRRD
jgi:hypothetical protein